MLLAQIKEKLTMSIVPVLCAFFIFYLGYHGLYGKNGVLRYFQLEQQKDHLEYQLSVIKGERELLDRRVENLRGAPLDLDLLDESARRVLGYADPKDVVIFRPMDEPGLMD